MCRRMREPCRRSLLSLGNKNRMSDACWMGLNESLFVTLPFRMDPAAEGSQRQEKGTVAAIQPMGGSLEGSQEAETGGQAAETTATTASAAAVATPNS